MTGCRASVSTDADRVAWRSGPFFFFFSLKTLDRPGNLDNPRLFLNKPSKRHLSLSR